MLKERITELIEEGKSFTFDDNSEIVNETNGITWFDVAYSLPSHKLVIWKLAALDIIRENFKDNETIIEQVKNLNKNYIEGDLEDDFTRNHKQLLGTLELCKQKTLEVFLRREAKESSMLEARKRADSKAASDLKVLTKDFENLKTSFLLKDVENGELKKVIKDLENRAKIPEAPKKESWFIRQFKTPLSRIIGILTFIGIVYGVGFWSHSIKRDLDIKALEEEVESLTNQNKVLNTYYTTLDSTNTILQTKYTEATEEIQMLEQALKDSNEVADN